MSSFYRSFTYAFNGLRLAFKDNHMKVHALMAFGVVCAGLFFGITQTEWLICFILFGLVMSLEVINTAIEHFVDLVEPNFNPKAGAIKDLAAGAVLVASIVAVVCGVLIFGKYIVDLFSFT
ncbi:MAG: diacylglycerol kinase family protein [Bacteroidota bacterium]